MIYLHRFSCSIQIVSQEKKEKKKKEKVKKQKSGYNVKTIRIPRISGKTTYNSQKSLNER